MKEVLKTSSLEYEKSIFYLDVVKHENGELYMNIKQIVFLKQTDPLSMRIKLTPSLLNDLAGVLKDYHAFITEYRISGKPHLNDELKSDEVKPQKDSELFRRLT